MPRSYRDIIRSRSKEHEERDDWFAAQSGTVVEVDPATMSVKVTINALDEERVYDEWVPVLTPFAGPAGYGAAFMPGLGSEVILFSTGNEGVTIFALGVFGEDSDVPAEFAGGAADGLKTSKGLKLLADGDATVRSERQVRVEGGDGVDTDAPVVRLLGGGGEVVRITPGKLGLHGAGGVGRVQLPPAANSQPTCIALANAIREFLIERGDCS